MGHFAWDGAGKDPVFADEAAIFRAARRSTARMSKLPLSRKQALVVRQLQPSKGRADSEIIRHHRKRQSALATTAAFDADVDRQLGIVNVDAAARHDATGATTARAAEPGSPPQSRVGSTELALRVPIRRCVQRLAGSGSAAMFR